MKILIAEDNAFSRTLLKKTLTKAGYEVSAVDNGDAAWQLLQGENPPKLALIDWMMPGLSGIELCRKIREIDTAIPVYMILLTAKSDKEDVLEGFAAGADDFIKKPFDSGELLARIQVGRRLVEQQALMHCLIDSIPDPIYVKDSRGLYLGCNRAYSEFTGADADSIHSCSSAEVLPAEQAQQAHMEDLRVLANGELLETEGWVNGKDNKPAYHDTVKIPYLESSGGSTGMISYSRDLTRRMEMEQEMRRLAVAVEQSAESIIITDVKGGILYVNKTFESTSGYSSDEVLGKHPDILSGGRVDKEIMDAMRTAMAAGETWSGQLTRRKKNGNLYHEEVVIYPIRNDAGDLVNYVSICRDITQEMAIEKHLRQQQKMNAIGVLAGGVSHDFNNILTAILGYVALCMNSVDEQDKVYGYLKEIVKAGDRATKLVRQILTFSRQEEQEFHSVELQPVIMDCLNMVKTTMKSNISLETELDDQCGSILGDTTQIQQVLINLCTNAAHALGRKEPGTLFISLTQVELLGGKPADETVDLASGHYACIKVQDTGCGMPPEVMERIFEPYFTTKKKGEGTGFGLSIVHGIIRKHRGSISVESEEGFGTTFTIYLPLLMHSVEQEEQASELSTPEGTGRILFVDDDEAVLSMGRDMLESFGFTVVTATNGRRAFEIYKLDPAGFDALVSDYNMPEMNGYEFIEKAREMRRDVPAVLCSGYMEKAEGEDMQKLGVNAFMAKPVDWRELCRIIQQGINA